jgi:hypothetical protein
MLTAIGVAFLVLVLIFITGGYFLYVLAACVGIALLCAFHYVLWGKALTQAVAGEREEELLRRQAEMEDWDEPADPMHPDSIRRP